MHGRKNRGTNTTQIFSEEINSCRAVGGLQTLEGADLLLRELANHSTFLQPLCSQSSRHHGNCGIRVDCCVLIMDILKLVAQITRKHDQRVIDDRFIKGHEFIKDQPLDPQEAATHSHGNALQVQL